MRLGQYRRTLKIEIFGPDLVPKAAFSLAIEPSSAYSWGTFFAYSPLRCLLDAIFPLREKAQIASKSSN